MLPFKQAILFPFDFYYKVRFENLSGKICLDVLKIKRGMIKIGGRGSEMFERSTTIVDIKGEVSFNGTTELGHGVLLRVEKEGMVLFGKDVRIGAKSKIFCEERIVFGNEIDFSWECQIFDTNFHFIRNLENNKIEPMTAPIIIGSFNFIGNRVTMMKGTKTPDHFIVASNSLCNKDYSTFPSFTVFGGIPAKFIEEKKERVFENIEDISFFKKNYMK